MNNSLNYILLQFKMPHENAAKQRYEEPSAVNRERLTALLPMDIWFYNYAVQMHEVQFQKYKWRIHGNSGKKFNVNEFIAKLPSKIHGCKTSRFNIRCPSNWHEYYNKYIKPKEITHGLHS